MTVLLFSPWLLMHTLRAFVTLGADKCTQSLFLLLNIEYLSMYLSGAIFNCAFTDDWCAFAGGTSGKTKKEGHWNRNDLATSSGAGSGVTGPAGDHTDGKGQRRCEDG